MYHKTIIRFAICMISRIIQTSDVVIRLSHRNRQIALILVWIFLDIMLCLIQHFIKSLNFIYHWCFQGEQGNRRSLHCFRLRNAVPLLREIKYIGQLYSTALKIMLANWKQLLMPSEFHLFQSQTKTWRLTPVTSYLLIKLFFIFSFLHFVGSFCDFFCNILVKF